MLSSQDNEVLCRVGPSTAMGETLRQFWIPALVSEELPSPDCPPTRMRLLGEDLIGFRTTSGKVGIVANSCPHRGASLFFGRNEEEGLRCVYHGWKFDVTGECVDMPSEPAESNFKAKVRATAYPTQERGGVVWVYMGPRAVPPPLPDIEPNMLAEGQCFVTKTMRECNWFQGLEGDIDTVHFAFLHSGSIRSEDTTPGTTNFYIAQQRSAKFLVKETDYGTCYGAYRPADADSYYWRIAQYMFPFFTETPNGILGVQVYVRAWIPLDDEHTMLWQFASRSRSLGTDLQSRGGSSASRREGAGVDGEPLLPDTSGWLGKFRPAQNKSNDYLIDRKAQSDGVSFTGIPGIPQQDQAMTEGMGPIYNRSHEHLGTTDSMIIRSRRMAIDVAKAYVHSGRVPLGVDHPEIFRQRSGALLLPRSADWWEATSERRKGFVDRPELVGSLI